MIGKKLLIYRSPITKGDSKIIITDLCPIAEKDIPVIFAPGWGATCLFYERIFFALRDSGRRVIGVEGFADVKNVPPAWPEAEARKASALLSVLDHLNIPRADLLGQSAGAFPVTLAAMLEPSRFRNLVLVTPAGFIGHVPFLKLIFHWFTDNAKDPLTRPLLIKNGGAFFSILKNIFSDLRVSIEGLKSVLKFSMDAFISEIKEKGIKVAVLYGENDTIIPSHLLLPRVQAADLIMPILGPHGSLIFLPHGTEKVMEAFGNLRNIQEKDNTQYESK